MKPDLQNNPELLALELFSLIVKLEDMSDKKGPDHE